MFKKVLICLMFLLVIISCEKKEDNKNLLAKYLKIDKIVNTGIQFRGMLTGFSFAVFDDQVFMKPQRTNEGMSINIYNIKTKKSSLQVFKYNTVLNDSLSYNEAGDMDVNKEFIFISYSNFLLVIDRANSQNTYLVNLKEPFMNLEAFGDVVILTRAYDFSPTATTTPIRIAMYNINSKKITKYVDPVSDALEFSYFGPANWIDISQKGEAVFTSTLTPEHFFYDSNFELKQKFGCIPKNWKSINMKDLNALRKSKVRLSPQAIIADLSKTDESDGCRIISVNFANDSTLLAFYSAPSKSEKSEFVRYCNVWKKQNEKWVLFDKGLKDAYPSESTKLSKDNFPFNGSFHKLKFYQNKALYIDVTPDEKDLLQFGTNFGKVKKEMNRYFAEEKLYHKLVIYNCRF